MATMSSVSICHKDRSFNDKTTNASINLYVGEYSVSLFTSVLYTLSIFSLYSFSQISNVENLSPQIIRRVAKEMTDLSAQPPEGIRVIINDEDVTDIQAVIEGPGELRFAQFFSPRASSKMSLSSCYVSARRTRLSMTYAIERLR